MAWSTSVTTSPNSIRIVWLLILLALVIERLYRRRYLHRCEHGIRTASGSTGVEPLAGSVPHNG